MTRVVIVADTLHRARGLARLLSDEERLEIVDARATSFRHDGDSAELADVVVALGLSIAQVPRSSTPVVVLSDIAAPVLPRHAIHAWLPVDSSAAEITGAIGAVVNGFTVVTAQQASRWFRSADAVVDDSPQTETLTPRESQVLRLLALGLGNKELAARLGISDHTAKFHVAQVLAKLGVGSRAEAVAVGIRRGLLPI